MTSPKWSLKGEYFENCNCEVLCPCVIGGRNAVPTEGHCDVIFAFHVQNGEFEDITLNGLNIVLACYTPGNMADGNWTSALYLDDRATPQQRRSLEQIMSGTVGGPAAERWMALTTNFLDTKYVSIEFKVEGRKHSLLIPDIIDFNIEPIMAPGQEDALRLDNTAHPVSRDLYLAKGTNSTYNDHGMTWDNTGKNGHYATFEWHGP